MQCETCGKLIKEGKKVKIEGSVVVTCNECAAYGTIIGEVKKEEKKPVRSVPAPAVAPSESLIVEKEMFVDDFHDRIRKAREKKGLKQEDLARLLNEPVSLVHRLEAGRFEPDDGLVKRLEGRLGVHLKEKTNELSIKGLKKGDAKDLTFGDIVVVKKKK